MGASGKLRKKINKNNMPPPSGTTELTAQMADPEKREKISPKKLQQVETVTAMMMKLIHSKESSQAAIGMLKADPDPAKAIPIAANRLLGVVEKKFKQRRSTIPNDVKVASIQYAVADLALLGNKAKLWDREVTKEELGPILKDTMQQYIQRGIKSGDINPVELQREVEPLMSDEQKAVANKYGQEAGIAPKPTATMAAEDYKNKEVQKALQGNNPSQKGLPQGGA